MPEFAELAFWLKNAIAGLSLPPAVTLLGLVIGFACLRRRPRIGRALIGSSTVLLFACSLPLVANALAAHDERRYPPLAAARVLPARAAIVVLGGGAQFGALDYDGETVNPTTLARLRAAAHLARRTQLPILLSGGRLPAALHAEAEEMADVMDRDFQLPVRWIEAGSLDTADNARLSVPILKAAGIDTAVLVTDVSHMRRAQGAFEAAGIAVVVAPTDYYASAPITPLSFVPSANALRRTNWTLHEWLGSLWMQLRR